MKGIIENLMNPKCKEEPFFGGKSIGQLERLLGRTARRNRKSGIELEQTQKGATFFLQSIELDLTEELNFTVNTGERFIKEKTLELENIKSNYPDYVSREVANTPDSLLEEIDQLKADISKLEAEKKDLQTFFETLNTKDDEQEKVNEPREELHSHTAGILFNGTSGGIH